MLIFVDRMVDEEGKSKVEKVLNYLNRFIDFERVRRRCDFAEIESKSSEYGERIRITTLKESCRGYKDNIILYYGNFNKEKIWFMESMLVPLYKKGENIKRERDGVFLPLNEF